jgi:hypothetical protein
MRARMQNGEDVGSLVSEVPLMNHERKRVKRKEKKEKLIGE